jgi:iron-sulfur cluster repair protein YtfE (RIC family)
MTIPSISASSTSNDRADALEHLRREQTSLIKLFFAFHLLCERDDTEQEKRAIVERLHLELAVHIQSVEDVVHAALPPSETDGALIDEARSEHASVREMIAKIVGSPPDDPQRDARVEALGEYVERHLAHEKNLLFPRLRQADIDLKALGQSLVERREQLLAQYGRLLSHGSEPEDESDDPVGPPAAND